MCAKAVYGCLMDSCQPEYYRYAVIVSQLDVEEVRSNVGRAKLTHACAGSQLCNDMLDFTELPTLMSGDNNISRILSVRSVYITPNQQTV